MFQMDFDFVINYDGYFQALILRLEVGEDLVLRSSMSGERDERPKKRNSSSRNGALNDQTLKKTC